MDLSKLSNEDLMALHSKQYDKLSNEGLTYLHQQNQPKPSSAMSGTSNNQIAGAPTEKPIYGNQTQTNLQNHDSIISQVKRAAVNNLPLMGGALGAIGFGPIGAPIGAGVGSMAKNLVTGDKSDPRTAIKNVGWDSVTQGVVPEVGGSILSGAARGFSGGLKSGADYLAQKAAGLKEYTEGLGNKMLDNGIWGTEKQMANKVNNVLATKNAALDNTVHGLQGTVDSAPVASKVNDFANDQFTTGGGLTPDSVKTMKNSVMTRAQDIGSRGAVSPAEALDLKRIAQKEAYSLKTGEPLSKLQSRAAREEAFGYGEGINDLASSQGKNTAGLNKDISDFIPVAEQLNAPDKISKLTPSLTDMGLFGGSSAFGHPLIGAGVVGAKKIASLPVTQSSTAAGMNSLAKIIGAPGVQMLSKQAPRTLQALLNGQSDEQ